MARAGVVALALLVVLAGCSTLPHTDTPPRTTVPVGAESEGAAAPGGEWPPEPTERGSGDGEVTRLPPSIAMNYPPGVAPDGIYDVDALAASHERRLNQTSYTLAWTATSHESDGTVRSRVSHRVEADPVAGRLLVAVNETGPVVAVDDRTAFRADGTTYVRDGGERPTPPATTTTTMDGRTVLGYDRARTDDAAALLAAFAVEDVRRRRTTDGTRYLLLSERLSDPDALGVVADATVSNASLVALLDASAVVRRLRVSYDVTRNGTTVRHARTLRVTRVGTTTVERPAWAGNATGGDPPAGARTTTAG